MKKMLIAVTTASLVALGMLSTSTPATAAAPTKPTITVTGTGTVTVKRDQATTGLTVTSLAPTAKEAMARTTATFNAVRKAIVDQGVKADDLSTGGVTLYPEYEYVNDRAPVLKGYRASVSLQAKSSVALSATIVDVAVSTGGDAVTISGISFDVADPDSVGDQSRQRAIVNAMGKAKVYAKALGQRVGKAITVMENSTTTPSPIYSNAVKAGADSVGTIDLDPGTQKVITTVTVTFQLLG